MDHRQGNARGFVTAAEGTCAVVGGLLLVGLLAAAFAMGEWNFAGKMPPEGEYATIWQRLDAAQGTPEDTQLATRR